MSSLRLSIPKSCSSSTDLPVPDLNLLPSPPRPLTPTSSCVNIHFSNDEIPFISPNITGHTLPEIVGDTLIEIMNGKYSHVISKHRIIDCRFPHEFEEGHIRGALNYNDPELLFESFFTDPSPNTALIFHCELSQNRAPQMAELFRLHDRNNNHYPDVTYPHVYVLKGGFSKFYQKHREYVDGNYLRMMDIPEDILKHENTVFKENYERAKLKEQGLNYPFPSNAHHMNLNSPIRTSFSQIPAFHLQRVMITPLLM